MESQNLLKKISKGDRKAFRQFYELYFHKVYRFVHYFIQEDSLCDAVVSEVFFLIWQMGESLTTIQNIDSYIYIMSRNEAFKTLKENNKQTNVSIDDMAVELVCKTASAEDILTDQELKSIYDSAVAKLPERCKLIYLMVREQKLKHKEIAEILSIQVGTVEAHMNTAIRRIVSVVKRKYPSINLDRRKHGGNN